MHIVNIIQGTDLGGMEQASLRLMLGLKERGHTCEVISLNPIGGLGPLLEENNIPAIGLPYLGKWGWRSYFLLRKTLQSVKADALIMTGHSLVAMLALGNLCKGRRLLAVHFHHTGVKPNWQWRLMYRKAYKRFQTITFPSDFIRLEAEEIYSPIKPISKTVYNPLPAWLPPTAEERDLAKSAFGIPLNSPVIGNAGWLISRKRFDVFLRTAKKILYQVPDALFLIAGEGEEKEKLVSLAQELNINDHVRWIGWQKNMSRFYHCLDLMLFNSDWDAVGLAPLEAISYGIPLVASVEQGGLKEILNKDEYAFLISEHNIDILSEKAVYYLQNHQEASKIALKGRERIVNVSNVSNIAGVIESLLSK